MKSLIIALQFLTRITIDDEIETDTSDFVRSVRTYPLVGYFLGLSLVFLLVVLARIGVPLSAAVVLVVVGEIALTGGLHLDGLMDCADGLFSNRPKDQVLQIMKDSRVGANAVLSLLCLILVKIALLLTIEQDLYWSIVLMPLLSRWVLLDLIVHFSYAGRPGSLGGLLIGRATRADFLVGTVVACFLIGLNSIFVKGFCSWPIGSALLFSFVVWLVVWIFARELAKFANHKLDGLTGDVLGAVLEVTEVFFLLLLVLFQSIDPYLIF